MTDFDSDYEKLALAVAKDAALPDTPLADRVDALKALFQYYALRKKVKQTDDVESGTMADLARRIHNAEDDDDPDTPSQPRLSS